MDRADEIELAQARLVCEAFSEFDDHMRHCQLDDCQQCAVAMHRVRTAWNVWASGRVVAQAAARGGLTRTQWEGGAP